MNLLKTGIFLFSLILISCATDPVGQIFSENKDQFRKCYLRHVNIKKANPEEGELSFFLLVDKEGAVTSAKIERSVGNLPESLKKCSLAVAKKMHFNWLRNNKELKVHKTAKFTVKHLIIQKD